MSDMAIVWFVDARLDEEQRAAEWAEAAASPEDNPGTEWFANQADSSGDSIVAMYPSRALAEVAAKRAILAATGRLNDDHLTRPLICDVVLEHLASVYSDHADYRQEWKP